MKAIMNACAAALVLAGCAADVGRAEHEIIDGENVADGQLPTIGAVLTNTGALCSATLISPTTALTAAHCVDPELLRAEAEAAGITPPDDITYQVVLATNLMNTRPTDHFAVESVEPHEDFMLTEETVLMEPGMVNDIALVRLATPASGRPTQRLALASDLHALAPGDTLLIAGYGETESDAIASAGVLHRGVSRLDLLGDHELIAGMGDRQQVCHGDSGGPVFLDASSSIQIGIASRLYVDSAMVPTEAPPCNTGAVYTRIDAYRDWIEERVDDLPAPSNCSISPARASAWPLAVVLAAMVLVRRRR
jgi:secreted trypsin-like serine protease